MPLSHLTPAPCQWFSRLAAALDRRSAIRPALVFVGAVLARGRRTAVLYGVAGTCRHFGIEPFAFLREVLLTPFGPEKSAGDNVQVDLRLDVWQKHQVSARGGDFRSDSVTAIPRRPPR
jgi:hypothetical protein